MAQTAGVYLRANARAAGCRGAGGTHGMHGAGVARVSASVRPWLCIQLLLLLQQRREPLTEKPGCRKLLRCTHDEVARSAATEPSYSTYATSQSRRPRSASPMHDAAPLAAAQLVGRVRGDEATKRRT